MAIEGFARRQSLDWDHEMRRMRRALLLGAGLTCALVAPAWAQTTPAAQLAPASSGQDNDGEIVVTASRYEQSLQRVPAAISAIGGDALQEEGVSSAKDLSGMVPSLQIGSNGSTGSADIGIRGISTRNVNAYSGAPTVAVHIDGVYVPRPVALQQSLFDISRIEVLRGPQGTLYGRNATAGVINIISQRPTKDVGYQASPAGLAYSRC